MISTYALKVRTKQRARVLLQRSEAIYRLYATIKGPLEDRDVERTERRYRAEAARLGVRALAGEELKRALGQRLAARGVPVRLPQANGEADPGFNYAPLGGEAR